MLRSLTLFLSLGAVGLGAGGCGGAPPTPPTPPAPVASGAAKAPPSVPDWSRCRIVPLDGVTEVRCPQISLSLQAQVTKETVEGFIELQGGRRIVRAEAEIDSAPAHTWTFLMRNHRDDRGWMVFARGNAAFCAAPDAFEARCQHALRLAMRGALPMEQMGKYVYFDEPMPVPEGCSRDDMDVMCADHSRLTLLPDDGGAFDTQVTHRRLRIDQTEGALPFRVVDCTVRLADEAKCTLRTVCDADGDLIVLDAVARTQTARAYLLCSWWSRAGTRQACADLITLPSDVTPVSCAP